MKPIKVLVACEYSGAVRNAFRARGFDAWSCDLLPSEDNSKYHIQGDVLATYVMEQHWDLMIAHPPCTHLAVSGARWFKDKQDEQKEALDFVRMLLNVPVKHIALENPVSIISSKIRKPDQIIQPWMFGHWETKATCLWLKDLPLLSPYFKNYDEYRIANNLASDAMPDNRIHKMAPSPNRWKERSRTYKGIAEAMAEQWGKYIEDHQNI